MQLQTMAVVCRNESINLLIRQFSYKATLAERKLRKYCCTLHV